MTSLKEIKINRINKKAVKYGNLNILSKGCLRLYNDEVVDYYVVKNLVSSVYLSNDRKRIAVSRCLGGVATVGRNDVYVVDASLNEDKQAMAITAMYLKGNDATLLSMENIHNFYSVGGSYIDPEQNNNEITLVMLDSDASLEAIMAKAFGKKYAGLFGFRDTLRKDTTAHVASLAMRDQLQADRAEKKEIKAEAKEAAKREKKLKEVEKLVDENCAEKKPAAKGMIDMLKNIKNINTSTEKVSEEVADIKTKATKVVTE